MFFIIQNVILFLVICPLKRLMLFIMIIQAAFEFIQGRED